MKYCLQNIIFCLILFSCVEPQNIALDGGKEWVVFGLVGEKNPPVIFVYGTDLIEGKVRYHYDATIVIKDVERDESFTLQRVFNDTTKYYDTNEFPFSKDASGNFVYYSSPIFEARANANYEVDFDLGKERGKAELFLPNQSAFSSVEIVANNQGRKSIEMIIKEEEGENYYKWDIGIDQVLQFPIPIIDTVNGDTLSLTTEINIRENYLPNNYITDAKIAENGNFFRFNLFQNITDYPSIEETYLLNVRLRNYGQETIDYFESVRDQNNASSFDPFVEPIFIQSNIDGIIGIVGTFSYSPNILLEYQP